jgi:hypothetical protein
MELTNGNVSSFTMSLDGTSLMPNIFGPEVGSLKEEPWEGLRPAMVRYGGQVPIPASMVTIEKLYCVDIDEGK